MKDMKGDEAMWREERRHECLDPLTARNKIIGERNVVTPEIAHHDALIHIPILIGE